MAIFEHTDDKLRYQGAAFQFIGFDELTQFDEKDYLYLFSRNRRSRTMVDNNIPLRVRCASNPGGRGASWVKQRFLIEGKQNGRIFIPAVLADNKEIDYASYFENLMELDPVTREQLLNGDWEVNSGGKIFQRNWFEILDREPSSLVYTPTVRYWDLAATEKGQGKNGYEPAFTVGLKMKKYPDFFLITDIRRFQKNTTDVEREILATAHQDGKNCEIWMEEEPGSSGVKVIDDYRKLLNHFTFRGQKESGSKVMRAAKTAADSGAGKIKLLRGIWNTAFLDEAEFFPDSKYKDQIDSMSGAHHKLNNFVSYSVMPTAVGSEMGSYWTG